MIACARKVADKYCDHVHGVDYYGLLGVGKDASTTEIKSAYRSLARSMHPDAGGTPGAFQLLRQAYETLSDPARRGAYDRGLTLAAPVSTKPRRTDRPRSFGEDPDFVPASASLDPDSIPWWHTVHSGERARPATPNAPGHAPALSLLSWLVVVVTPSAIVLAVWLVFTVAVVFWLIRRHLAMVRAERALAAEFGGDPVFGRTGTDPDQWGERLTAELLSRYLTRLPGARIFHGLAWPGSVFADIDHAVLAGRRLVLIESKTWLPGHYEIDEDGTLWRNDQRFRGGATRLPDAVALYRDLLPDVEVRGAIVVYPSRAGDITTGPGAGVPQDTEDFDLPAPPMTPEQFVHEIGAWLAEDSSTVDTEVLRTVLRHVVSHFPG